jgi:hypothetical protein
VRAKPIATVLSALVKRMNNAFLKQICPVGRTALIAR